MTEPQKSFKELPEGAVLEPPKSFKELPEGAVLEPQKSFKELPEDAVLEDDLSIDEIKKMQSEGVKLSEKLQRKLFDAEDERGLLDKAAGAASAFLPAAADIIGQTASGAVELANKAVVQPAAFALSGGYNRLDSEEAKKVFKDREEALRSVAVGAAKDVEETANAAVRAIYFGTGVTDKLLGKSKEERFRRWQDRQAMRDLEAKSLEENPDRAAYLLSQNPLIQGYVEYEAKKMGLSPEEVEKVKQDYIQSMLDQGLTKEQINQNIAALGEFISPVSVPGAGKLSDVALKPLSKITAPVMNKAAELAVRGTSKLAQGTEYAANKVLQGTELLQTGARKIGEYAINDPDTWIKGTVNTAIMPVVGVAKPVSATARVIRDITNIDVGGTAGRMGMVQMAGQRINSSDLTKQLFGPQGKGGVARAKLADWTIRQSNALIQPGVNAAAMNVVMGLPDIETAEDLGFTAGTGFGIGSLAGVRSYDRLSGLVDPRKTMAEKITNFVTPDPAAYRRDEDADIKRFMAQATPDIQQNITDLADIEKRKAAVDATIASLEKERDAQIDPDDAAFKQTQIDGFLKQKEALSKATPETQAEALRQTQLAFIDAYDLAQSTGGVAGLRGVNIAVLDSANADQFFRDLYGDSLKQAETTINLLTGMPSLTETDSQKLTEARQLIQKFQNDVEGAKTTRGFAIQEDNTDPNSPNFVPPHLRRINQVGATAVINADLIKHLSTQGFNVRHTLQHEVQHAVQQFAEVNKMLAPLRGQLFDQKIKNDDGTTEVYQQGIYSDEDLNRYAARYAKLMSPSDGGASFYAQFGGDSEKMRAYIKDEILAETAAATGEYAGGTRASLDDVGRNVMDWLEVKTKSGRLKQLKEALRRNGVIFDNVGAVSSVLDAQMSPETLAMVRQYQRGLKDFDGTMTVQQSRESDEPDIPLTKVLGSVALQNKYRHADFFEKEQIIKATAPDGSVTEIVIPKEAKIDPFIDVYRTQGGQLVDANGNVVTLGPEITFGSMPDGTTFEVDTRIARKSNGSPIILTNREMKSRALERTKMIQNAIDSAKDDGSGVRLSDTGNGNYRGVMSPAQIEAFMALPNYVVSPNLKRMTKFFNELMARNDGTRVMIEYQAALLNGKYKALSPKIRDEVPIGFQLTKDGNFLITTISVSRLHDKMMAWADKKPSNLTLWNGDTDAFWASTMKYLDNHAKGEKGETGLNPDSYIAGKMKNRINDLFNAYNSETKESNPERSTLPRARGKDNLDTVIRGRRLDRINNFSESPSLKIPINYGHLTTNYMPAVNPMAAPMTAEEMQNRFDGSVTATRVRRAMATGEIDALESELRQMDDLLPTESLQLVQGEGEMPRIQIVSMFDPENVASLEPEEIVSDIDAETEAELAILDAQDGTVPPQDIAKVLSSKLDQLYADGGRSPIIPALESELEKIYQQLESQAQEQAAATEDIVEAPETTEVDMMNSPTDLIAQAVDNYNTGKVDNETQTLPEYIRSVVNEAGSLQIPPDITDEQIAAAANDAIQSRDSLKQRIQGGTQFMPANRDYPSVGININSKTQDFTDQILRGEKTIETRPSNSLKSLIGKRVGIVRTGKGKATLVGYANIEEPIVYNNVEEFRADQDKHLVEAGSDFDIKPDQKKYGYPLTDVESIEPIEVPSNLPNWYSARSIPQTQFMPAENTAAFSDVPAPEAQQEVEKPLSMVRLSDAPEPPKKYAFAYTTSSDRIPLVDALVKAKNWQAIRDLNQATIRHAMSDLPNVKYTLKDLVGAFENEREISVMPEFEITSPEELAEVRKRMVSLGELWQQTEVLEEQVGGGDQNLLGTVDTDGYLHIGKATLTFDKLTPALVEKARQASGIQAMSYDNNSVIFYDTDNNPAEFERRVDRFTGFVTENGRVLEARTADSAKVRSYRNPNSPKAGSLYYNEDPIRLFGEGQLPDRLRSPVYRVVSELLGRVLPPPKDGRASYFVKEDVTPKQVKLQNAIAKKQEAVVLNDKKNKDVVKAYEELNAELLKQFDALVAGGMTFTAAPDYDVYNSLYPDSASVIRDIRNNNNLVYLKTTPETFGPVQNGKRMDFSFHPILKDSGRTDASGNKMSYNDILRVVHDAIAHGIYSAQFGPVGEESAWNTHIRTIDNPWARWALTMETRAQNSWVNYQDKFLTEKKTGEDRMPLKKGDKGFIPVSARDYAEQKFALIPLKYTLTGDAKVDKPVKDLMEEIGEKRAEGSPEKDPEWMPSKKEREKIYASIKQPQGTPKDLLKQASDVIGKLTRKDDAENVPVIVEKAWVEKKSKDEDAEDATDDSVEDGEVITTSTAVLKDVVVYSLRGTPIVVRPLPNLLAENVKTKVSKNVLAIAEDEKKYLEYSNRVLTAADKLRQDPEMFTTPSGYLQFMRESGASGNLLMPPSQITQLVKNPNTILQLWQGGYHGNKTAPGTVAAAIAGLDSVNEMRDLFIQDGVNLGPTRMITGLHHMWGILSRQLDPYNQEALWMRMVSYRPVMEQLQLSIDGQFALTKGEWQMVVQDARRATKGDYQKAGNNATANANAFHLMLTKHNGKWGELANIYKASDPLVMTNAFWGLGVGATGIKNKVQRFIGLTFGIHGSVLDRWRFVGLNLPMAMKLTGKATPELYFNYYGRNKTIPEDPVGIYKSYGTVENGNSVFSTALYAGIDRTIQGVIDNSKEMRDFLGVHATPGGFHWVDWNCVKNEAVGHSSLDLTKEFLKRKGRNGTVDDFMDVVQTSTAFTRADQDGRIIDLVMKDGIFQVVEQK